MKKMNKMKKTDVQIHGKTYTVRATTDAGLREGIRQLRRSIEGMIQRGENL